MNSAALIPVILFAYARPDHLRRTLDGLRNNNIPLLYIFSDGPKTPEAVERVHEVRAILHEIDWCEVHLKEKMDNLGLGASILAGVTEISQKHEAFIVFEDDLTCLPGTYQYMAAALRHYADSPSVMSVTGWTLPRITPSGVTDQPYFDGRAESWSWGTWSRVWKDGMSRSAQELVAACVERDIDIYRYGADLPEMAKIELEQNIWAVRFLYLHILNGGLCLRPPYTLVEHAGFDDLATNATDGRIWANAIHKEFAPPIPSKWPEPVENMECPVLWQKAFSRKPKLLKQVKILIKKISDYLHS